MAPTCERCGSTSLSLIEGRLFCNRCGTQFEGFVEEVSEFDQNLLSHRGLSAKKKRKQKKSEPPPKRVDYFEALNYILKAQVKAISDLYSLNHEALFEMVGILWKRFLHVVHKKLNFVVSLSEAELKQKEDQLIEKEIEEDTQELIQESQTQDTQTQESQTQDTQTQDTQTQESQTQDTQTQKSHHQIKTGLEIQIDQELKILEQELENDNQPKKKKKKKKDDGKEEIEKQNDNKEDLQQENEEQNDEEDYDEEALKKTFRNANVPPEEYFITNNYPSYFTTYHITYLACLYLRIGIPPFEFLQKIKSKEIPYIDPLGIFPYPFYSSSTIMLFSRSIPNSYSFENRCGRLIQLLDTHPTPPFNIHMYISTLVKTRNLPEPLIEIVDFLAQNDFIDLQLHLYKKVKDSNLSSRILGVVLMGIKLCYGLEIINIAPNIDGFQFPPFLKFMELIQNKTTHLLRVNERSDAKWKEKAEFLIENVKSLKFSQAEKTLVSIIPILERLSKENFPSSQTIEKEEDENLCEEYWNFYNQQKNFETIPGYSAYLIPYKIQHPKTISLSYLLISLNFLGNLTTLQILRALRIFEQKCLAMKQAELKKLNLPIDMLSRPYPFNQK